MRLRPPSSLEICILAGGLSERMGRDKSRLQLGERTMLGQIRFTAKTLGHPVRVIRRDTVPRCGPLGGVYTALSTTGADAVLFLACDMPLVTESLLRAVKGRFGGRGIGLFVNSENNPGFPFVLHRDALAVVARQIEQGEFSLHGLARKLRARKFSLPPHQQAQLRNANTPKEWSGVKQLWPKPSKRQRRVSHQSPTPH